MRRRILLLLPLVALLVVPARSAVAAETCFGEAATIVGTNRDPSQAVEIHGTPGDDVIVGLDGMDTIFGRGGDDLICAGGGDDYVKAGGGSDRADGMAGFDTLHGGEGVDELRGGSGSDSLTGGPGNDHLWGGTGSQDSLIGGQGDDMLHGGAGYDLAEYWNSPRGVEADLRSGTAVGHGHDTIVAIEGLVGSNFDDVLLGDDRSNELQGGEGNDVLKAFGSGLDGGADLLRTSGGDNVVRGGAGPDIISYNRVPWPVTVDLAAGTTTSEVGTDTLAGIEHVVGSRESDTLLGDDRDNVIFGSAGDDFMDGRGGVDEVAFDDAREPVTADLGAGTAEAGWWGTDTFVHFENLAGSVWRDVLTGNDGPNLIRGWDRNDLLVGLGGADRLLGGPGTDEADGGRGIDACEAEVHNCELAVTASLASWSPWSEQGQRVS